MCFKQFFFAVLFLLIISSCADLSDPIDPTIYAYSSWELVRESQNEGFYNSIYFINATNGWAVGDSGIVIHTYDGGITWIFQQSGTENSLQDIQFINLNIGWIVGSDNTILKTENGGKDWIVRQLPGELSKTIMSLSFIDEDTGWIVDNYGGIFHTSNAGNSWIPQESNIHWAITSVQFFNKNHGWAICTNKIALETNNGGTKWNHIKIPTISDTSPIVCNDIFFINEDNGWISGTYAGSTMPESVPLYHTTNAGLNWETQVILPSRAVNSILFIDKNYGCITSAGKIFFSSDGGYTWQIQLQDENEIFKDVSFVNLFNGWVLGYRGSIYKYVLSIK